MSSKKYSAIFEVGATVASSVSTVGKAARGDFSGMTKAMRDLQRQQDKLNQYDPQGVRSMGREYRDLKRDAAKLTRVFEKSKKPTKEMRREMLAAQRSADKAGKAFHAERKRLQALEIELEESGVNTKNFRQEQRRLATEVDRTSNKLKNLQGVVGAGAGVGSAVASTTHEVGRLAAGFGLVVGAAGTALTMTNKVTAEQEALARAVGVSSNEFDAWAGLSHEMGFEADNVGDMVEEMNNKLGESAGLEEISAVKDSLQMLGLEFDDIRDMAPEEQFRTIAKAIKETNDAQTAVSAADMLFGGEANKFFGYLRSRKEGVDDLLAQQKELNLLSDEGRAGAAAYNTAFSRLTTVVGSAAREVSGLVGGALAPYVKDIAPKVGAWMKEHRKDVVDFAKGIGEALPKIGAFASGLLSVLGSVGSALDTVAGALGGWENMAWVVGGLISSKLVVSMFTLGKSVFTLYSALTPVIGSVLPALAVGIKAVGAAVMANPIGIVIGAAVIAVYRLVTAWEDLKKSFSVGGVWGAVKTFFGAGEDAQNNGATAGSPSAAPAVPALPAAGGGQNISVRQEIPIQIHAAPGQSAEEVAEHVMRKMDERQRDVGRGALYDGATA